MFLALLRKPGLRREIQMTLRETPELEEYSQSSILY